MLTNVTSVAYSIMAFALILITGELKGQLFIYHKTKNPQAQMPAGKGEELRPSFIKATGDFSYVCVASLKLV